MRKILQDPNPLLHQISQPVDTIDSYIKDLVKEMLGLRSYRPYLGLSAVQLGELVRVIIIVQNGLNEHATPIVIVNPQIVKLSGKILQSQEGCLSVAHGRTLFMVRRHKIVKVRGLNLDGDPISSKEHGLLAYVLQHEVDHLEGKLISDVRS